MYVQYSFDQLFMKCQHNKMIHGPKIVDNHWLTSRQDARFVKTELFLF